MSEFEKAKTFIKGSLKESYDSTNPDELSNIIIALAGWRFRLGECVASTGADFERSCASRKQKENELFCAHKISGKTDGESKIHASMGSKSETEAEIAAQKEFNETKNLWEDLKIAIDSIKYKINSLLKEKEET
jgi:hypothetical protein